MKVAAEAVHRGHEGLLRLGEEGAGVGGVEHVLSRPDGASAVSDVGDERETGVEGVEDLATRAVAVADLPQEDLGRLPPGEEGGLDVAGFGLEVAGGIGVVGDEGDPSVEVVALGLPVEDLLDHGLGLLEGRRREASDREVGKGIVAIDGGESGVGRRRDVRGPVHEERHRRGLRGGVEVPRVVVGVSEEEDVAGGGTPPMVVGEGEEVADGLGRGLPAAERGGDLLERGGERGEALGLPP